MSIVSLIPKLRFGGILFLVVAVPGLANYVLTSNGFKILGTISWATGYGLGIFAIWYIWIRPLDLSGSIK